MLYVGRISKEKNLDRLIQAFLELSDDHRPVSLVIVGDGPYLYELNKRYPFPGIAYTGLLQGDDLATAYASADLFVFPSTTDTFGNAVLEALASGLPTVVSDQGGPRELVEGLGCGLVVDLEPPGALSAAIASLLDDDARRKRMAERALEASTVHRWRARFETLWRGGDDAAPEATEPTLDPEATQEQERIDLAISA